MPSSVALIASTLVPGVDRLVALLDPLAQRLDEVGSAPAISWSSSSTTVTLEPSASWTVAISRPMIPPPITSSRSGTSGSSSAPVESTIRGSSGRSGSATACEPTAMIACSKATSVPSTSSVFAPVNFAVPCTTSTLRVLAMPAEAVGELLHGAVLERAHAVEVDLGLAEGDPRAGASSASASTSARCSSALEGMQPTLRQTPPRRS